MDLNELAIILNNCYKEIYNGPLYLTVEPVKSSLTTGDLEEKIFSGLRSRVWKHPMAFFLNLSTLAPKEQIFAMQRERATSQVKKGALLVCQKESNERANYEEAKKEAEVLKILSRETDLVPWAFGYNTDGNKVTAVMEYLGDFHLGKAFREPSDPAKSILIYLLNNNLVSGVVQTDLYGKISSYSGKRKIICSEDEVKGAIEELEWLNIISKQKSGTSWEIRVEPGFYKRYDENESRNRKELVENKHYKDYKWDVIKEGLETSISLRKKASEPKILDKLKKIAGLKNFNNGGKKSSAAERMTNFILEKFDSFVHPKTAESIAYNNGISDIRADLISDLIKLNEIPDYFITHDNYADNLMRRTILSNEHFLWPLNDGLRKDKIVAIDAYCSCIGPYVLDDACFNAHAQAALGIDPRALTMHTISELHARFGYDSSAEGEKLFEKLTVLEAIRYFAANKKRLGRDGRPSRLDKRLLTSINAGYLKVIDGAVDSNLFSSKITQFIDDYLLPEEEGGES